jgi:Ca-activated chloride channel family protein
MTFAHPHYLLLLLLLPLAVLVYRWAVWRPAEAHVVLPGAGRLLGIGHSRKPWRYLPALLYLAALAAGVVAVARPTVKLMVPEDTAGIMLAVEASFSMRSGDIPPNRLEATKAAIRTLMSRIPKHIKIGLVTFSGYATLNTPPTLEREKLLEALDLIEMSWGFAFTKGLEESLSALPEIAAEGGTPGIVVLFSHGHDNTGSDPMEIAKAAADRGIRIHSVGVGTHGNNFNDDILKKVSDETKGRYYPVKTAEDLQGAHADLGKVLSLKPKPTEMTAVLAMLAALCLGLSLVLSGNRRQVV